MSLLVQSTQKRAFNLSKTTLFESRKLLSWSVGMPRKEALELQEERSNGGYQKGFEVRRWILSEICKGYTPDARIMIS